MSTEFSILTVNVAGLNNVVKRNRVKTLLMQLATDNVCLQQKHILKDEERYLRQVCWGQVYHTSSGTHLNGVMIGSKKREFWQPNLVKLDTDGCYIVES